MVNSNQKRTTRPLVVALALGTVLALVAGWLVGAQQEELPRLFPMPAFQLTSEQGQPFDSSSLEGKVVVANFIFTRCPTVCPMLTARMARLQSGISESAGVHFLSFSVDPKHDTPEVLRAYGQEYDQDPRRWTFLTGDLGAITEAVEAGFKVGMEGAEDPDANPFDIVHGEHFVLVDKAGQIRGYYQSDEESLEKLRSDVGRLLSEKRS